jgi:hypothetical protein
VRRSLRRVTGAAASTGCRRVGGELPLGDGAKIGAGPAALGEQRVRARERGDARLDGRREAPRVVRWREPQHRLHHRQRVLGPVVHLADEQRLPHLVGLAGGNVAHDAGEEALALGVAPFRDGEVERHGRAVLAAASTSRPMPMIFRSPVLR